MEQENSLKKLIKLILKIIFFIPIILIIVQIFNIFNGISSGVDTGMLGNGNIVYGIEALLHNWFWIGFLGIIYIPFIIYQLIYMKIIKQKLFKRIFIVELILILIIEAPLLYQLIVHGF